MMTFDTALRLGRVSNLPTVATNAMAGVALAGAGLGGEPLAVVVLAAALAYVAGMFLNDAFDAPHDRLNQPFRPIPAGHAGRSEVFVWGYCMLATSVVLFVLAGARSGTGWGVGVAGAALAVTIVAYNRHHKENAFGPLLMGLCRLLVYCAAALAVVAIPGHQLWIGAGLLMAHVMGLTFIAKREGAGRIGRWWPLAFILAAPVYGLVVSTSNLIVLPFALSLLVADIIAIRLSTGPAANPGRAIPLLIASITLLDGLLIAGQGHVLLALLAVAAFPLTLYLQKWVRGT